MDDFHLINATVATHAGNTTINVSRVTKLHIIRGLVDLHPLDRLAIIERVGLVHRPMQRFKLRTLTLHVLVAVPAGICRRNIRVVRDIDKRVTIAAVEAQLVGVDFVRKRNWLRWLVAYNR